MNLKTLTLRITGISAIGAAVGRCLNDLVCFANSQYMPVYDKGCPAGVIWDRLHVCAFPGVHLKFLADYIHIGNVVYSPGDMLIYFGGSIAIIFGVAFVYSLLEHWMKKI